MYQTNRYAANSDSYIVVTKLETGQSIIAINHVLIYEPDVLLLPLREYVSREIVF